MDDLIRRADVLKLIDDWIDDFEDDNNHKCVKSLQLARSDIKKIPATPAARLLTAECVRTMHKVPVWYQQRKPTTGEWVIICTTVDPRHKNLYAEYPSSAQMDEYGKTWRCWSAEPTVEQLQTPWEETAADKCPFCGSDNVFTFCHFCVGCFCGCDDCEARGAIKDTEQEAIEAWNRRVNK